LSATLARLTAATALALALAACGAEQPTGAPAEALDERPAQLLGGLELHLLHCTALPAAQDSVTVGPEGGTLAVGPHLLRIPAGAVSAPTTFGMRIVSDAVNEVELSPHGLVFPTNARPTLSLSYRNCDALLSLPKRVAYTDDMLNILELPASLDAAADQRVDATLDHFSRYAVSY
jgi:hypothetical protein